MSDCEAFLHRADPTGAKVNDKQLAEAKSLESNAMPHGATHLASYVLFFC